MAELPILHTGRRFRVNDVEQALAWLAAYNLGTLITVDDDGWPRATTSPLVVDQNDGARLYAHIDRHNPQVDSLINGLPLLFVAHGPRAYVSPSFFTRRPAAPTYLHVTVHVRARARQLNDEWAAWVLLQTVDSFEQRLPQPWRYDGGERFLNGMAKGICAFELVVDGIEAACKLSQDRDHDERASIAAALEKSDSSNDRLVAAMVRALDQ